MRHPRIALALLLAACSGRGTPAPTTPAGAAAEVRAVADELNALFVTATADTSAWPATTDRQIEENVARNRRWLARLEQIDGAQLTGTPEWALHANLVERSRNQLAQRVCRFELWSLSTFGGWHLQAADAARTARVDNDSARSRILARFAALPSRIALDVTRLRRGAAEGYTVPAPVVRAVIAQLDALTPPDPVTSPFDGPASRGSGDFPAAWRALVRDTVYPAVLGFRRFLEQEYLPQARASGSMAAQRDGEACYRAQLRTIAGRDVDPAALMADARQFLDSLRSVLAPAARRLTGQAEVDSAVRHLRTEPRFTVASRDTLLGMYRSAMERARLAMPRFFARTTDRPVVVEPHGPAQERAGFPAQYSSAPADGSRPARVFVNLARNERMTVGFGVAHEGFPGHHQERAMQSDITGTHPSVARLFNSGFTEGWGLYSEWLAEEMGIYADDLEVLGYQIHLTDAALGAILDVGYHVFGWTREALVDSMMRTSGRTRELAEAYADRHAATPSQIATYHLGYRAITRARARAAAALGPRFDLREFHDVVLGEGTLPLPALDEKVDLWVRRDR